MTATAAARPGLYTQIEVGKVLGFRRDTVREVVPRLGFAWKRDPHRPGRPRCLDAADVVGLGTIFGTEPAWSRLSA